MRVELSWPEYDFLWEEFGHGRFPAVLAITRHGRTLDERDAHRRAAWQSLRDKGLVDHDGVDPRLERLLGRLAQPERELDGRLQLRSTGPRTSALVATVRTMATVAVLDPGSLRLWSVPAHRVPPTAEGLLPAHPPGTGRSITFPADVLDDAAAKAGTDAEALARGLVAQGLGKAEARKVAEVAGGVIRFGHFGAARTEDGQRTRAPHVVSVYDTRGARYLFCRKPSRGAQWVTLAPATSQVLARQLAELGPV